MKTQFYFVEMTDTYAGEANYSWVTRLKIKASTHRGAANKIGAYMGLQYHKEWDNGDMARYNSKSGATCYFIEAWDDEARGQYLNLKEI